MSVKFSNPSRETYGEYDADFNLLVQFQKSGADDRTLAIVVASYAEKYLGELIKHRLPGMNSELREKLFDPNGFLGSFAAKIDIGRALQTINADMHHDLKILASIRNRFAHDLAVSSFDHPEIAKRLDKFRLKPDLVGASVTKEKKRAFLEKYEKWSRRVKFEYIGISICMALHSGMNAVRLARLKHGAKH